MIQGAVGVAELFAREQQEAVHAHVGALGLLDGLGLVAREGAAEADGVRGVDRIAGKGRHAAAQVMGLLVLALHPDVLEARAGGHRELGRRVGEGGPVAQGDVVLDEGRLAHGLEGHLDPGRGHDGRLLRDGDEQEVDGRGRELRAGDPDGGRGRREEGVQGVEGVPLGRIPGFGGELDGVAQGAHVREVRRVQAVDEDHAARPGLGQDEGGDVLEGDLGGLGGRSEGRLLEGGEVGEAPLLVLDGGQGEG
ncbi:hypothetical protein D3C86_1375730 [compost metagenome]